ncbi:MAG: hypothetical protein AABY22_01115 [Nanoarchaeota archaeon]
MTTTIKNWLKTRMILKKDSTGVDVIIKNKWKLAKELREAFKNNDAGEGYSEDIVDLLEYLADEFNTEFFFADIDLRKKDVRLIFQGY